MPITSIRPPTDSLYKFVAISGLVLVVVAVVVWLQTWQDYTAAVIDAVDPMSDAKRAVIDNYEALTSAAEPDEEQRQERIRQTGRRAEEAERRAQNALMKVKVANARYDRFQTLGTVLCIVGFAAMILGFILWYRRIQRYQDRIIKKQAESAT